MRDLDRSDRSFIASMLSIGASMETQDGVVSSYPLVEQTLRSGICGDGNSVRTVSVRARETAKTNPKLVAKINGLQPIARSVAMAIMRDGQGDCLLPRTFGIKIVQLTLSQRIGFMLATDKQVSRWTRAIVSGQRDGLSAAGELGIELIKFAAEEWGKDAKEAI